jgi:hypothetical protein
MRRIAAGSSNGRDATSKIDADPRIAAFALALLSGACPYRRTGSYTRVEPEGRLSPGHALRHPQLHAERRLAMAGAPVQQSRLDLAAGDAARIPRDLVQHVAIRRLRRWRHG